MRKVLFVAAMLALVLANVQAPPEARALAPMQETDGGMHVNPNPTEQLAYTLEDLESANPAPMPVVQNLSEADAPSDEFEVLADGPAGYVNGHGIAGALQPIAAGTVGGAGTGTPNLTYPYPYALSYVQISGLTSTAPYSTNGKLVFHNDYFGPGWWYCSATSITSGSGGGTNRLLLTAAWCLLPDGWGAGAGNSWSYDLVFYPGLLGGSVPWIFDVWLNEYAPLSHEGAFNRREDWGFVLMGDEACGRVGSCVGAQGIAWNQPRMVEYWGFGYASAPFPGDRTVLCTGPTAKLGSPAGTGPQTQGMGCGQTGGSLGGGMIISFKTANMGYVNSNFSYKLNSGDFYGPYYQNSFYSRWLTARNDYP
jgi:hypothetical protein